MLHRDRLVAACKAILDAPAPAHPFIDWTGDVGHLVARAATDWHLWQAIHAERPDLLRDTPKPDGRGLLRRRPSDYWLAHQLRMIDPRLALYPADGQPHLPSHCSWIIGKATGRKPGSVKQAIKRRHGYR